MTNIYVVYNDARGKNAYFSTLEAAEAFIRQDATGDCGSTTPSSQVIEFMRRNYDISLKVLDQQEYQ